ncbi:MAG: hypothetical protein ACPGJV_09320 [Bacteriovoracaceae bacterium]
MKAKNLKVRVTKNDEVRVNLTLPINALKVVDTLMPSHVLAIIEKKGIKLKELIEKVKVSDYKPQDLFKFDNETEAKSYHVWIE